jgi:ankyrin repeat protein
MNGNIEKDDDGRTWIHHSVRKTESLECLRSLLSSETMQLRDNDGRTCLHVAAEQGSVHACRLIFETNDQLNNSSYIHDGDKYRQTPLHLATKNGHARVLKELLDHGADPHLKGNEISMHAIFHRSYL